MAIAAFDEFKPSRPFFVGVDSDGCVFDTMGYKHRECFCPAFLETFALGRIEVEARETWEFVNLFSLSRGLNRFQALLRFVELLAERPEIIERKILVPKLGRLSEWVAVSKRLSNDALEEAFAASGDTELGLVLAWSKSVNARVKAIDRKPKPFPGALAAMSALSERADIVVVSQTPAEAIVREWAEAGLAPFVTSVAGQEVGSKSGALLGATRGHPDSTALRYEKERILMIGDAPGDEEAADAAGALFFPIVPGKEEESWRLFLSEGLPRFFAGTFAGEFQAAVKADFVESLPDSPPWARAPIATEASACRGWLAPTDKDRLLESRSGAEAPSPT